MARELWVVEERSGADWLPVHAASFETRRRAESSARQYARLFSRECRVVRYVPDPKP
jgi:hypothetical protein